jgi:predicted transcriptional regulator
MTAEDEHRRMSDRSPPDSPDHATDDRTVFERVYDVVTTTTTPTTVSTIADRADCSDTGARRVLTQLVELGIATEQGTRPVEYRRNDSYFEWKRIEALAADHSEPALRERFERLQQEDEQYQSAFGVPTPEAVTAQTGPDDPETRWEEVRNWQTVRRDIRLVRRALDRVVASADDRGRA